MSAIVHHAVTESHVFRVGELVNAIGGTLVVGRPDDVIGAVSTDTRRLAPGELFWALQGERFDAVAFVDEALAKGACGAVVPERSASESTWKTRDVVIISVRDTLRALQDAAAFHRRRFRLPVVAITGSNGKTTTKEMTAAILGGRGAVLATQGNLNNHIGVPLTLFGLTVAHIAAVIEMGVNHHGEMTRLCEIARPTVGLITNIGHAHLEGLGGVEGVARAKGELFHALGPDDVAVVNVDDRRVSELARALRSRVVTFGMEAADVRGRVLEDRTRSGTRIEIRSGQHRTECFIPIVGRHNAINAVAAAAVGVTLGLDLDGIREGLERFQPAAMRTEFVTTPSGLVVLNDAYNANPSSMARALETVGSLREAGRVYAVLGDMLELGTAEEQLHREVGVAAARSRLDGLVTVGRAARWIGEEARRAGMAEHAVVSVDAAEEAIPVIAAWARAGDLVLIKGSRRMGLERVATGLGASGHAALHA